MNSYKTRSLNAGLITLLLVFGLFVGEWGTSIYYNEQLNEIQNELVTTQENLEIYKSAYEEALGHAQYEYEVNENLEMDLAEAMATIASFTDKECDFIYLGELNIGTRTGAVWMIVEKDA